MNQILKNKIINQILKSKIINQIKSLFKKNFQNIHKVYKSLLNLIKILNEFLFMILFHLEVEKLN